MRRRVVSCFCWVGVFVSAMGLATASNESLKAGVARVSLNPPPGLAMSGYGARKGVSEGTLDELQGKVLVLSNPETQIAIVTLDLSAVFPPREMERIRRRVKDSSGIDDVIFTCSHTHSGPVQEVESPAQWQIQAAENIIRAVEEAWRSKVDVRIGWGTGNVSIGHNRLYFKRTGSGKMLWRNETRIRTSPVDPTVTVIRIDRETGGSLAVLVNYACHPVVLGPENLNYSADYPGEMMRLVESAAPGSPLCLFVQGAAGDTNPYYDKTPVSENAVNLMKETGAVLAREVLKVLDRISPVSLSVPEIQITREVLPLRSRWNKDKVLKRLEGVALSDSMKVRVERMVKDEYPTELTIALIGQQLAFVGVPAEIFVDYQMEIRERLPELGVIFAGYTNGSIGYVPTIQGAVDGGYGASEAGSVVEVGAGDWMIDRAVIQLAYWLGKLKHQADSYQ